MPERDHQNDQQKAMLPAHTPMQGMRLEALKLAHDLFVSTGIQQDTFSDPKKILNVADVYFGYIYSGQKPSDTPPV